MEDVIISPAWPPMNARRQRLKYSPIAWVQGAPQVPELAGKRFFHYVFSRLTIAALATGEALLTTDRPFWLVALMGTATQAIAQTGSFRLQLADQGVRDDRLDRHFFQMKGLNQLGVVAVGTDPNFAIVPHFIPPDHPVALRVVNLAAVQNVIDTTMFGYVDAPLYGYQVDDGGLRSNAATNRNLPPNL